VVGAVGGLGGPEAPWLSGADGHGGRVAARLADVPEGQRGAALARFRRLRPVLEGRAPVARLARELGVARGTVQRWVARYRREGLAGLARRPRADRGRPRLSSALRHLVEGLALERPPRSAATVQRRAAAVAAARGWPAPSYKQVYTLVRRLDPALVSLAHEGPRAYRERFDLLYRREAGRPNELWQADHTPLDLWVRDARGRPARPWLTVILDDYSRAVAGYAVSLHAPSALQTALALRQAIWRKAEPHWHVCGIPAVFYTDHGSDFTSRHLEQVAADLPMALVFSTPGVPRGRGKIERFFGTVNQLFLSALPGYTPPGSPPATPALTLPELDTRLHRFLVEEYHGRTHGETGQAPQARWEAGGFLPRLPETLEQLDLLLLTVAQPRRVHQDGIRFQGLRYLDLTLAAYVGEDVVIRYDPRDLAEVRVYHRGAFLCRALCQELTGQTIGLEALTRARNERRQQLRTGLSERAAAVAALLAVHQPQAPPGQLPQPPAPPGAAPPRLKRYLND
jgi:putative transposase